MRDAAPKKFSGSKSDFQALSEKCTEAVFLGSQNSFQAKVVLQCDSNALLETNRANQTSLLFIA